MRNEYHQPDIDGSEPDAPYLSAGIPSAELLARWVADALISHPGALSSLAHQAITAFEDAPADSAEEASLGLLSDLLHDALAGELEEPEPEACDICGAVGQGFTLYVDSAGIGHNVCAACDDEPVPPSDDAEDRHNRGGW